jgi:hypothetical protein
MKRLLFTLFIVGLPASAQWRHFGSDQTRFTGYFGAGFATPVNPLAKRLDPGWSLGGGVGVTNNHIGLMFDAMFVDMGMNHRTLASVGAPRGDQKYWALTANPVFHVNESGPVDFYVTAGGGLYSQITEYRTGYHGDPFYGYDDLLGSYTLYRAGVNGGAGFSFRLGYGNSIRFFAEARFHHMFTHGSGASFIPVTVGVRF